MIYADNTYMFRFADVAVFESTKHPDKGWVVLKSSIWQETAQCYSNAPYYHEGLLKVKEAWIKWAETQQ
ncbi:hypothetical protein [Dickeya phage Amaethon]|nr:hypothetical protein [Dickeya phage Amaethon]